jgi:hypothetical protein
LIVCCGSVAINVNGGSINVSNTTRLDSNGVAVVSSGGSDIVAVVNCSTDCTDGIADDSDDVAVISGCTDGVADVSSGGSDGVAVVSGGPIDVVLAVAWIAVVARGSINISDTTGTDSNIVAASNGCSDVVTVVDGCSDVVGGSTINACVVEIS